MRNDTQRGAGAASYAAFAAFAAFGVFWGTWGATLPALRDAAGLDEAALGVALLFVGLGALPAMLLTGRAVDRLGARVAGPLLVALACAGVLTAVLARDLRTLAIGMAVVGATSGAADVAANALAGLAEQRSGRRVLTISHGVFSAAVVVGSLGAGALRTAGADAVWVFAAAGALITVAGTAVHMLGDGPHPAPSVEAGRRRNRVRFAWPLIAVGLIGALGFAAENAHQSWSAIYLADELGAAPGLAATAPATFAVFAALTRFAAGVLTRISSRVLLLGGALTALAGTLLLSIAGNVPVALTGLAVAAIGTSVLFPTLLSLATRDVPAAGADEPHPPLRPSPTLGFVLGPVYVGALAGAAGLRGAMVGVAMLVAAFALLAPLVARRRDHAAGADRTNDVEHGPTSTSR